MKSLKLKWKGLMIKLIEHLENKYVAEEDRNAYLQETVSDLMSYNEDLIHDNNMLSDTLDHLQHERR